MAQGKLNPVACYRAEQDRQAQISDLVAEMRAEGDKPYLVAERAAERLGVSERQARRHIEKRKKIMDTLDLLKSERP